MWIVCFFQLFSINKSFFAVSKNLKIKYKFPRQELVWLKKVERTFTINIFFDNIVSEVRILTKINKSCKLFWVENS